MGKNETQRKATVVFGAFIASAILFGAASGSEEKAQAARPDIISIDSIAQFHELKRPAVPFLHDMHTKALDKQGKSCDACHQKDDQGLFIPQFVDLPGADMQALQNLYHGKCIACHKEQAAAGRETGPVVTSDCGVCHQLRPRTVSSRREIRLDKSLHYRHVKASAKKCELCHHELDERQQKLVYIKGRERSCRDCHRRTSEGNRRSMKRVSHRKCVGCHLEKTEKNMDSGPKSCAGCHDADSQLAFIRPAKVPRLKSGQPDAALVRAADPRHARINTVPFDHKQHEETTSSCRACHHENMQACRDCHTLFGDKKGGGVTLARSMHAPTSSHSCVGCHNQIKQRPGCSGCHSIMKQEPLGKGECSVCHSGPPPSSPLIAATRPENIGKFLKEKSYGKLSWKDGDIPKNITIDHLSDKYEQVTFPHRKIIDTLRKNARDSALAKSFHGGEDTLCMGCHHSTPKEMKPLACRNCHGRSFAGNMGMTGLKGAYHLQCMRCHEQMGLTKLNGCTACHKEKK
ncbi:MAG: sulfate respiration complex hexadecaheme cytochrome HmcA [Elusimicrobiota bacterium]